MTAVSYQSLAVEWQPQPRADARFRYLLIAVVVALLGLGLVLASIEVPEKSRHERASVPERVARFVMKKEPVARPKPKPKVELPPPPVVEQPPRVERERPTKDRKPLTEEQKKAREVAETSGLLALKEEMSGLMTAGAQARSAVTGKLSGDGGADVVAGHNAAVITAGTAGRSGGVDGAKYALNTGPSSLRQHQVTEALADIPADDLGEETDVAAEKGKDRPAGGRSRESVTMVLDQHKGMLYSLYERERRKTLGLQGVVVLELTIAPTGEVTDAKIVSSELNSPSLEARLVARIKMMTFEPMDSLPLTVTFPIEFLPS
jgi:protein TonB